MAQCSKAILSNLKAALFHEDDDEDANQLRMFLITTTNSKQQSKWSEKTIQLALKFSDSLNLFVRLDIRSLIQYDDPDYTPSKKSPVFMVWGSLKKYILYKYEIWHFFWPTNLFEHPLCALWVHILIPAPGNESPTYRLSNDTTINSQSLVELKIFEIDCGAPWKKWPFYQNEALWSTFGWPTIM